MSAKYFITDTKELNVLKNKLNSLQLKSDERKKLLHSLALETQSQTLERFDFQKDPEGSAWQHIAESTRRYYAKKGIGGSILQRGAAGLMDSIDIRVDENEAEIGATKIYGAVHQFGFPKRNIPKRAYLGVNENDERELLAIIESYLTRVVEAKK